MKSTISISLSQYEDVFESIQRALTHLQPLNISNNDTIIIKINICDARMPETGAITHPLFLDAVIKYLRTNYENLRIFVVESDATVVIADKFIRWFGYIPVLQKWDAEFINLSKQKIINRKTDGGYFKNIPIPELFDKPNFFITLPKLKINPLPTITCCLKNQFGCLPVPEKNIYHSRLDDVIADVNKTLCPDLCLVDGIIAMGGTWGPAFGVPIPLNTIICSRDPVAADAFGARLMGFNPWLIGHIRKSASCGVGSMRYEIKGDTPEKVDFEINKLETFLLNRVGVFLQKRSRKEFRTVGGKSW